MKLRGIVLALLLLGALPAAANIRQAPEPEPVSYTHLTLPTTPYV